MKKISAKTLITNLALSLMATLLCIAVVEGAFRVKAYLYESDLYAKKDKIKENLQNKGFLSNTDFGTRIQPSKYEDIFFELKPLQQWNYLGADVSTSSMGFRDREYTVEKAPGTLRIFGIGDSIMFGQGVPQEETYLSLLEAMLNKRHPEYNWEVINSAVPDYNTSAEVETLRYKGLKYKPDLVVMGICTNDFDMPALVFYMGLPDERNMGRYFSLQHSFFVQYIRHRMKREPFLIPGFTHKYVEMSGGKGVFKAIKELKRISIIGDFPVLVFHLANDTNKNVMDLMKTANAYGMPAVDVSPMIQRYMKYQGIKDYFDSALSVSDGHPSSTSHEIAANALFEYLESSGLVSMLLSKEPGPSSR
ncbi:MAG: SGNH/GDSL hydrolase family protein [Thermodesulfovibrionales bacterium]|nr:SGNH/GDSL hydrolase family protein [Thermodesulfovibrionales bacterium]